MLKTVLSARRSFYLSKGSKSKVWWAFSVDFQLLGAMMKTNISSAKVHSLLEYY